MGMKLRKWGIGALMILLAIAGSWMIILRTNANGTAAYSTTQVSRGTISTSVTATGSLEPLTTVEVKSNVGGELVYLGVDEGDQVKSGQVIARIDPSDAESTLEQSQADLDSAKSRAEQARQNLAMQQEQYPAQLLQAQQAVESARLKLAQAEKQAKVQPELTAASIEQARSSLAAAKSSYAQTNNALVPQKIDAAQTALENAQANLTLSEKNLQRQRQLLAKGYVAQSVVDSAEQGYSVAKASFDSARNKLATVKDEIREDLAAAQAKIDQAVAALKSAQANSVQDDVKNDDVAMARASLAQAQAALAAARANSYQVDVKAGDIVQAEATVKRSAATVANARVQVNYSTITAPRDGVVVKKYIEKGSIVAGARNAMGGSGTGVTLLDIADVSRMYALVNIDETDIAKISVGQEVRVTIDAFSDALYYGKVTRIAPQTTTAQNVTTVPVTVEVEAPDLRLKPGMNATCNFVTARHSDVLLVPRGAVKRASGTPTVTVIDNGKPVTRTVQTGLTDGTNIEILSGLQEGETIASTSAGASTASDASTQKSSGNSGGPGGPPPMF